jgi:hypothetical protein
MPDTMLLKEMVAAVQKHARDNYETDGWDYAVECWGFDELAEMIREPFMKFEPKRYAATPAEAIARVGEVCKLLASVRRDVQGEIF